MLSHTDEQQQCERHRAQVAARKARYRSRLRTGAAVLQIETCDLNRLVAYLIDLHWLDPSRSEDRAAINAAVAALLDDTVSHPERMDRQTTERVPSLRS
jgi:hypothetical protein